MNTGRSLCLAVQHSSQLRQSSGGQILCFKLQLQTCYYITSLSGSINYADSYSCDDCPGNSQSIWYMRQLPMQCVLWVTCCPTDWHFTLLLNALSVEFIAFCNNSKSDGVIVVLVAVALQLVSSGRLQVVFHHYRSAEHNTQRITLFKPRAAWKPAPGQIKSLWPHLCDSPTEFQVILRLAGASDWWGWFQMQRW